MIAHTGESGSVKGARTSPWPRYDEAALGFPQLLVSRDDVAASCAVARLRCKFSASKCCLSGTKENVLCAGEPLRSSRHPAFRRADAIPGTNTITCRYLRLDLSMLPTARASRR